MCHLTLFAWLSTNEEVNCNTFCASRASHYSESTLSQSYHTLETQKGGGTVESTLVRWLTLRYPRNRHACWKSFHCALGPSAQIKGHTSIVARLLAHISLTHSVKRVRQDYCPQNNLAWQYSYHMWGGSDCVVKRGGGPLLVWVAGRLCFLLFQF